MLHSRSYPYRTLNVDHTKVNLNADSNRAMDNNGFVAEGGDVIDGDREWMVVGDVEYGGLVDNSVDGGAVEIGTTDFDSWQHNYFTGWIVRVRIVAIYIQKWAQE